MSESISRGCSKSSTLSFMKHSDSCRNTGAAIINSFFSKSWTVSGEVCESEILDHSRLCVEMDFGEFFGD